MGKLTATTLLAATLLTPWLHASTPPVAAAAAGQPPSPPVAPPATPATPPAARYALDDLDQAVERNWSVAAIRSRATDPFGLPQDPTVQIQKPKLATNTSKYRNIAPTPFNEIVAAIPVNTVMPAKGRFLVRNRSFQVGDTFPINYQDKSVAVRVMRVSSDAIDFKNLQTGESASLSLGSMPRGMHKGSGREGPPGLERDDPAAPLQVDVAPPATAAAIEPR
jgi:hypothetical protein